MDKEIKNLRERTGIRGKSAKMQMGLNEVKRQNEFKKKKKNTRKQKSNKTKRQKKNVYIKIPSFAKCSTLSAGG